MEIYYNKSGAERKQLVMAISDILGIKSEYLGVPSLEYKIGDYKVSKVGTLSYLDENEANQEFVSKTNYLVEQLKERGFEALNPQRDEDEMEVTEFTISMPLEKVDVGNLINLLDAKGDLIKKALGIKDTFIKEENETVEFPWFTDLTSEELETYSKFIAALCEMSIKQKRVTAKPKEYENERYAFRCFLLRLGFIGDEYKVDRKLLLSKLEGSAAFKSDKKGGAA